MIVYETIFDETCRTGCGRIFYVSYWLYLWFHDRFIRRVVQELIEKAMLLAFSFFSVIFYLLKGVK